MELGRPQLPCLMGLVVGVMMWGLLRSDLGAEESLTLPGGASALATSPAEWPRQRALRHDRHA
ncbi:MAG: hypothetical protein ACI841_002819 [Planctomycetota bacterium]|jgi:hypothetical protein